MAIYINKTGTKVDENVVGTKSAEDWSAQGFSVYKPKTVAPTESVAPTVAPVNDTVIRADELNTPDNSVVNESAKMGTFATYDPVTGKAVNRRAIEVGQHGQNDYLETPIEGTAYAQNPDQYIVTHKDAKTLYGFKKPAQPAEETNVVKGGAGVEDTGTGKTGTGNPVLDELNNWLASNKSEIEKFSEDLTGQREDVAEQSKYVRDLRAELDSFKNEMDYNKVLQTTNVANTKLDYYNKSDEIKDEPVLASTVNSRLAKLTETTNIALDKESLAQAVADATNVYKYNSKLIEYNIAAGDLQSAQAMAQQTAQDIKDYKSQMLQIMQFQNQLTMQDYQMKQAEIDREYDMAEKGYTYVENLEALNDLAVKKGTDWVENNTMKIGGKIYIKPEVSDKVVSTINVDGHLWGINSNGDKIKDYGRTTNYQFDTDNDGNIVITDPSSGKVVTQYAPQQATLSIGSGVITGLNGSEKWKNGLDFVLDGGKGAPVTSPFMGKVIFAGVNGGFGNQVKVDVGDGTEVWLSHLDSINVQKGDFITEEMIIGNQGNTGDVYSLSGGDGTHLDITMKKPDGSYYSPQEVASFLGYKNQGGGAYEQNILTARLGKQIYGTRISDAESKRVENFIKAGTEQGKDQWQIIDDVVGYQIEDEANKPIADNFKGLLLQNTGESGLAGFDMLGLARLINSNNFGGAVTKTENMVYDQARSIDPDGFISESKTKSAIEKGDNLGEYINQLGDSPIGVVEGTMENWLGKFKSEEATTIKAQIVNLVAKMRNELLGSAVTETEERFLEPLIPALNDTPANFAAKIEQLQINPLLELNNYRTTFGMPQLDYGSLLNREQRAVLYMTSQDNMQSTDNEQINNEDPLGIL